MIQKVLGITLCVVGIIYGIIMLPYHYKNGHIEEVFNKGATVAIALAISAVLIFAR